MTSNPRPVRLSPVLSGGASLGAYHAGVVAALLTARNALASDRSLRIDPIGGASAGALVALLGGWALAAGRDPVWVLHEAWVERVSLDVLRSRDSRAPLSTAELRARLVDLFETAPRVDVETSATTVHVSLTGLRGLTYPVRGLRGERSIRASTYSDWFTRELPADVGTHDVSEPEGASLLDAALASAAHPGGFAPVLLDRSDDRHVYERHGIDDLPEPLKLWCSDGGLVQPEPVGRAVAAAGTDDESQRVAVLVDPRSENPGGAAKWSQGGWEPGWVDGLQRALSILPAHEMYEDLRRLERDNARLQWVERLTETLLPHLDDPARDDLRQVLEDIAEDEESLRPSDYEPGREVPDEDADLRIHLQQVLSEVAGVRGKSRIEADVISPLILADDGDHSQVPQLLAGEILGDFGGFLDRDLRASDFDLGYACALRWLEEGLPNTELPDHDIAAAVAAAKDAHHPDWEASNRGGARAGDLGWVARIAAARLSLQLLRVTAAELTGIDRLVPKPVGDATRKATGWIRARISRQDASSD